jgi:hypothetical protein
VVLLLGLIQLAQPIRGLFHHEPAPVAATKGMDLAAATGLAVRYTADYWSYDGGNPDARQSALGAYSGTTSTGVPAIAGAGTLHADVVTSGAVATAGRDVAVVQTTARVTPGLLPEGSTAPQTAPADAPGPASAPDPGAPAAPYTRGTPLWLTLDVVVHDTDTGLTVTGATLSGDAPAALPRPSPEVDAEITGVTTRDGLPDEMFTAIAESDLRYLTTPDLQLAGLSGVVALDGTSGWSVATDRADTGLRYADVDVTWQLAGTQLTVPQSYALSMTESDGRWLLAAVGPVIEEQ